VAGMWADSKLVGLKKENQDEADISEWLTKACLSASNSMSHIIHHDRH
jgi:hypothetical protein